MRSWFSNKCGIVFGMLIMASVAWPSDGRAESLFVFQGVYNAHSKALALNVRRPDASAITLTAKPSPDGAVALAVDIRRFKTPFFEIAASLAGQIRPVTDKDGARFIEGAWRSLSAMVNDKPIEEMSGKFQIKDNRIVVSDLSMGALSGGGLLSLTSPYPVDVAVNIRPVALRYYLGWLTGVGANVAGTGDVEGRLHMWGTFPRLSLEGDFDSFSGTIQGTGYDSLLLHLSGSYPMVEISRSSVTQANGLSFNIDGTIDLSDREHFSEQIQALRRTSIVAGNERQKEWILRRTVTEDDGTSEIKYFLRKDDNRFGGVIDGESGVFGMERRIGF